MADGQFHNRQFEDAIKKNLDEDWIKVEHIAHLVRKFGGRASVIEPGALIDELIKIGLKKNDATQRNIYDATVYLANSYLPCKGRFSSTWFPYVSTSHHGQKDVLKLLRAAYDLVNADQWQQPNSDDGLHAFNIKELPSGNIRVKYVEVTNHPGLTDPEHGLAKPERDWENHTAYFKRHGIEVRSAKTFANKVAKSASKVFDKTKGAPKIASRSVLISTRSHLLSAIREMGKDSLAENEPFGRLLRYCGPDGKLFVEDEEMGAHLRETDPSKKYLRCLIRLSTMPTIPGKKAKQLQAVDLLKSEMNSAVVDFDFRHPDGFLEEFIRVKLKNRNASFLTHASEPAIDSFWRAFENASPATSHLTSLGSASAP
jgi:hypothetical protein